MQQVEQAADVLAVLSGVSEHGRVPIDHVPVATALALPLDEPGVDQVGQDPLCGADGDADRVGDISKAHVGIPGDAEQDLRVVRDELPALSRALA